MEEYETFQKRIWRHFWPSVSKNISGAIKDSFNVRKECELLINLGKIILVMGVKRFYIKDCYWKFGKANDMIRCEGIS